ncbi:efflux transporter outer membrane subunit [Aquincola sp. MAHUQ-54]|uniref:Efflux transporter outer membrane subunit n=1 Tax=Aquincola agrisoli TaxID=3119538 RepID=A0AAW9QIN9_9BURK
MPAPASAPPGLPRAAIRRPPRNAVTWAAAGLALALAGCASTPLPDASPLSPPAQFKEAPPAGWLHAAPADLAARGPWWRLFDDPVLDRWVEAVEVSNQNVAAAAASYAQARALVREQRASRWPAVDLSGGATRSGGEASTSPANRRYQLGLGASWEADVWGRVAGSVAAAGARAQASEADLAAATLSAQAEVAANYFSLRETDAEMALLADTLAAYERAAQIARNRYDAGLALRSDVLQAETQLANTEADRVALERQRAQLEHAIAVLVGRAPADFDLPAGALADTLRADPPAVPAGLPSTLLQRRPDIAAAERRVAAANADVGVAQTGFYPSFTLTGQYGLSSTRVSDLFSASAAAWSLGLSLAQAVFDAGATQARVDQSRASWEQAVAGYRQTVLTAFQEVEDQLAALRTLERQLALRRIASAAADQTEQQVLNRYRAGQVGFTEVVTAQVSALSARRSVLQLIGQRQTATVSLIQALGGGWR